MNDLNMDVGFAKYYLSKNNRKQMKISAVAGFPNGDNPTREKIEQARRAINAGADEIDMVLDYDSLKSHNYENVYKDILEVSEAVHKKQGLLKVIFENSSFESDEKLIIKACEICTNAGVDFIKTSTGFGDYGARAEDLKIMRQSFWGGIKMAGGVNKDNIHSLLFAVSGRDDGCIDLDPMKVRIGESSLLNSSLEKQY